MRIVYDDCMMDIYKNKIENFLLDVASINPESVRKNDRVSEKLIREAIIRRFPELKFGRDVNNTGIGNNNCYELIFSDENEDIVFGLLHLTDDMFGGVICWLADYYDNPISGIKIKIR